MVLRNLATKSLKIHVLLVDLPNNFAPKEPRVEVVETKYSDPTYIKIVRGSTTTTTSTYPV